MTISGTWVESDGYDTQMDYDNNKPEIVDIINHKHTVHYTLAAALITETALGGVIRCPHRVSKQGLFDWDCALILGLYWRNSQFRVHIHCQGNVVQERRICVIHMHMPRSLPHQ